MVVRAAFFVSGVGGAVRAIRCPVCEVLLGEWVPDGHVLVRRDGRVVAIDPRVIPCRRRDCGGVVDLRERGPAVVSAVAATRRG